MWATLLGEAAWRRLREEVALLDGGRRRLRPRALPGRRADAGLLRQRADQLRRRAIPGRLGRAGAGAADRARAIAAPVPPHDPDFSGFIFKIQANMDPRHRDRMAFLRVCSGRFEQGHGGLQPTPGPDGPPRPAAPALRPGPGDGRGGVPGDVVGLVNPGLFAIGDTLCEASRSSTHPYRASPRSASPASRTAAPGGTSSSTPVWRSLKRKERIQVLYSIDGAREPILAAVGELQLDVTAARLRGEYGVEADVNRLPYETALWVEGAGDGGKGLNWPTRDALRTEDRDGRLVALFASDWVRRYTEEKNPGVVFRAMG